jgi:KaiC/GvpD/RAD55 family RecA-like ATPase
MKLSISNHKAEGFTPVKVNSIPDLIKLITQNKWSCGVFENGHRNLKNFQQADLIALDVDNNEGTEIKIDEAFKLLNNKYNAIILPTKSHKKAKNGVVRERYRIVLPLERTINSQQEYYKTWQKLAEEFPFVDPSCKDPSRYWDPSLATDEITTTSGAPVPIPQIEEKKEETRSEVESLLKGKLTRHTLEFIAIPPHSSSDKDKISNSKLFQACMDCYHQGYTKEEAQALLTPAVDKFGGWQNSDLKTLDSAYNNREPIHEKRGNVNCFNFKHLDDIAHGQEDVKWLVDGFLGEGCLTIFAGAPKSGKSTLTRQLANAVVKGHAFLKRTVKKGKVLYLALEEQEGLLAKQFKHIGVKNEDDILIHVGPIGHGNVVDALKEAITQYQASLLVVDTLLLLANFENPNDYNEAYKILSAYRNVARETGCHIIALHHQNKGEDRGANSILGSTAIQGAVDGSIILNNIRGRELYRKLSSWQRGGQRFIDQELKYMPELDIYEIGEGYTDDF